ncbi:hypothetical protein [Phaeobacter sp. B1627]|uniref:hypothetical protein n=1 Tax=Phaeobacter sp. B1627 TaxID=2583809 RepID=UPI00111946A4|nr:hypothetical protein [Phaeobacter sp. B1627]TNJ40594.1 hypothetical protein FGE21_17150 [Phaeobacter sp. B1627]
MKRHICATVFGLMLAAGLANAETLDGQGTYDLLFREGTLDSIARDTSLVYRRSVTNQLKPEAAERDSGDIALSIRPSDPSDLVKLELRQGDRHRGLGQFPASVGNPVIMFFYEATIRDMAEAAGGSPFYIRNRIKQALVEPSNVTAGLGEFEGETIETQTISLFPFEEDPNRERMQGFGDLELQVVMSEEVPGWYLALSAEAGAVYQSELRFDGLETAK